MIKYIIPVKSYDSTNFGSLLENNSSVDTFKDNVKCIPNEMVSDPPSMCKKYNVAVNYYKNDISEDNIFVFMHDDLSILDPNFEMKVKMIFKKDPNTMILGVIGTEMYDLNQNSPGWWHNYRSEFGVGSIIQGHPNGAENTMTGVRGNFSNKAIIVDGCILAIRSSFFKTNKFDEDLFTSFHHYDNDICLQAIHSGYNVSIANIIVKHESEGPMDENYHKDSVKLIDKWIGKFSWPIFKGIK